MNGSIKDIEKVRAVHPEYFNAGSIISIGRSTGSNMWLVGATTNSYFLALLISYYNSDSLVSCRGSGSSGTMTYEYRRVLMNTYTP